MKLRLRLNKVESNEPRPRPIANEKMPVSPSPKAKVGGANELPISPILKSKQSTGDLMFQMDDDVPLTPLGPVKGKAAVRGVEGRDTTTSRTDHDFPALGSNLAVRDRSSLDDRMASQEAQLDESPSESRIGVPYKSEPFSPSDISSHAAWGSPVPSNSKRDLKDIMAETSQARQPSHAPAAYNREPSSNFASKLSQKERRKLQQQQAQEKLAAEETSKEALKNPWKTSANKPPVKETEGASNGLPDPIKPAQKPAMTLRQTVAGTPPIKQRPGAAPVQPQGHGLSPNTQTPAKHPTPGSSTAAPSTSPNTAASAQRTVQSIRHIPRPEPQASTFHSPSSQSQSLASIFMQQQTEKNEIHEAATAKHNLHDIQLEQQFQEWWDKESKRVQEQADAESAATHPGRGGRSGRGKGNRALPPQSHKRRGGGGGPGGGGKGTTGNASDISALTQQLSGHGQKKNHNHRDQPPQQRTPSGGSHPDGTPVHHQARRGNNPRGRGKKDQGRKP